MYASLLRKIIRCRERYTAIRIIVFNDDREDLVVFFDMFDHHFIRFNKISPEEFFLLNSIPFGVK